MITHGTVRHYFCVNKRKGVTREVVQLKHWEDGLEPETIHRTWRLQFSNQLLIWNDFLTNSLSSCCKPCFWFSATAAVRPQTKFECCCCSQQAVGVLYASSHVAHILCWCCSPHPTVILGGRQQLTTLAINSWFML